MLPSRGGAGRLSKTLDEGTQASDPGGVELSEARLRALQPELFLPDGLDTLLAVEAEDERLWWLDHVPEHLREGDSRAAVVVALEPLRVAAYTDELDCVAVLHFSPEAAEYLNAQVGDRLLSVNTYSPRQEAGLAHDLTPGPAAREQWGNVSPFIAELFSEDRERIEARKAEIPEAEWERCQALGAAWLAAEVETRDGRPLFAHVPADEHPEQFRRAPPREGGWPIWLIVIVALFGFRLARKAFKAFRHAPAAALGDAASGAKKLRKGGKTLAQVGGEVAQRAETEEEEGERLERSMSNAFLEQYRKEKDPRQRGMLLGLLRNSLPRPEAVALFIEALGEKEATLRRSAARQLAACGASAKSALPALRRAAKDPDAGVAKAARKAVAAVEAK